MTEHTDESTLDAVRAERIAAIRARLAAHEGSPLRVHHTSPGWLAADHIDDGRRDEMQADESNAVLLVHAPDDLRFLLDEATRLSGTLAAAQADLRLAEAVVEEQRHALRRAQAGASD